MWSEFRDSTVLDHSLRSLRYVSHCCTNNRSDCSDYDSDRFCRVGHIDLQLLESPSGVRLEHQRKKAHRNGYLEMKSHCHNCSRWCILVDMYKRSRWAYFPNEKWDHRFLRRCLLRHKSWSDSLFRNVSEEISVWLILLFENEHGPVWTRPFSQTHE